MIVFISLCVSQFWKVIIIIAIKYTAFENWRQFKQKKDNGIQMIFYEKPHLHFQFDINSKNLSHFIINDDEKLVMVYGIKLTVHSILTHVLKLPKPVTCR